MAGKTYRQGMSLVQLMDRFPDDATAERWFIQQRWPDGILCAHCDSDRVAVSNHPTQPYRCLACKYHFSVKTGTVMHSSKLGYRKWALAVYLVTTNIKGISSMKLHRDIGVTQKTAWHMAHRIRKIWEEDKDLFAGPVEVDETYVGGKERNKHSSKKLRAGRGTVGKIAVAGARDRETNKVSAAVVPGTDRATLQGFVQDRAAVGATVYTDDHASYDGIPYRHETVRHSVSEYVNGQAHTNGIESFWATLKRGYHGIYHHVSPKHLDRYVSEFSGRHNDRGADTADQMDHIAAGMTGKRLRYSDLIS